MVPPADPAVHVTTCDIVQDTLIEIKALTDWPWRKIAQMPEYAPIPAGTLCRIAKTGYIPPKWYRRLGIPHLLPAPVCLECGEVHISKRCPKRSGEKRTPPIRIGELTAEERAWIMSLTVEERRERLMMGAWM